MIKRLVTVILSVVFFQVSLIALAEADALYLPDLGTSARMIALGNIEGFNWNSSAIFENPASLYKVNNYSVSAFTTRIIDEVDYLNISAAKKYSFGTLAIGYMDAGVSDIPKTAQVQTQTGREFIAERFFNYTNYMVKLGYQKNLSEKLSFGTTLDYYQSEMLDLRGKGYNVDIGMIYDKQDLILSVFARNVVTSVRPTYTFTTTENIGTEAYPFQTVWGVSYHAWDLDFMGQLKTSRLRNTPLKSFGIAYQPRWLSVFNLYLGSKEFYTLKSVDHNFTLGLGLDLFGLQFEYAYENSDHPEFKNYNYFSMNWNF